MMLTNSYQATTDQVRNKYNTLTPAEAKKLNRSLFTGGTIQSNGSTTSNNHHPQQRYGTLRNVPIRTASVLHKPRAPPIVVTNLDTTIDQLDGASFGASSSLLTSTDSSLQRYSVNNPIREHQLNRSSSIRSASLYSANVDDQIIRGHTIARMKYNTLNNASNRIFSGESYSSASSTLISSGETPSKFISESVATNDYTNGFDKPPRSASKTSLSASTYKVFQSPFANFKKLFRHIQHPFSTNSTSNADQDDELERNTDFNSSIVSQNDLNKSYSPVCPPPPGELKSMCYMDSAINYSNYDEFTRSRNERSTANQHGFTSSTAQNQQLDNLKNNHNDRAESDAWQLTSLPVYYERNLTTVFEDKNVTSTNTIDQRSLIIRPPSHFDDTGDATKSINDDTFRMRQHKLPTDGSMQSLNSYTTTGSGYQTPANPYRFSFAQPLHPTREISTDQVSCQKNAGLPPRVPADRLSINISENTRQDNSSSGNSSNCSSQLNGTNNRDRINSLENSERKSFNSNGDSTTTTTMMDTTNNGSVYGLMQGLSDNDADATLLSETSTIQGDTGISYYANKCDELERTVNTLKNKLISKEKELTDLQLNQLNNDYTIEKLKKQVNKLERENAQLKTLIANKN